MTTDPLSAVDISELPNYTEQFMEAEYNRQFELRNPVTKVEEPRAWYDPRDIDAGLFAKATSYLSGPGSVAFWGQRQWELSDVKDPGPDFNGVTYFKDKYPEYDQDTQYGSMLRNVFMQLDEMNKFGEPTSTSWMSPIGHLFGAGWLTNQVPSSPELIDALVMDGMSQQEELGKYYNMMEHLNTFQAGGLHVGNFAWQMAGDPTNLLMGIGAAKMGYRGLQGIAALNKTGTRKIMTAMAGAGTFNLAYEQLINEMNPATEIEGATNEWFAAGLGILLGGGLAGVGHAASTGQLGKVTPGWNWNRTRIGIKRMAHADNQRSDLNIRKVDSQGNPIQSMGAAPEMSTMKGALIESEGDMNIMLKNRYGEGDIVHVSYLKPGDKTHPVNMAARKLRAKAKQEGWHLQELEHPDQRIIDVFEDFDKIMDDPNWQGIATRSELDYGVTSKVLGNVNEKYARLQSMVNPGARQAHSTHRVVNDMYRTLSGSAHTITRASAKNPLGSKRGVTAEGYTHLLRDRTMKVTDRLSSIYKDARRTVKSNSFEMGETGLNYDGNKLKLPWIGGQTEFEEAVNDFIRRKHSVEMGMNKTVPDDVHPLILQAAKEVEGYYKAMGNELVEAGVLDADNKLLNHYLPISYSSQKIRANPEAFVSDMAMAFRNKQRLVDGKMLDSDDLIPIDPLVAERMNGKAGRDLFDGVEAKEIKEVTPEAVTKVERESTTTFETDGPYTAEYYSGKLYQDFLKIQKKSGIEENPAHKARRESLEKRSKVDEVAEEELGKINSALKDDPDGVQLTTGPATKTSRHKPGTPPDDVGTGGYPGQPAKSLRYGDDTTVLFADNTSAKAYYAFIEADELTPSNNPLGPRTANGGFPKDSQTGGWNHRSEDYANPIAGSNSIKTNEKIVRQPNYDVFYDKGSGTQMGPPIISATGYPDSGTNRTMALQRLYFGHGGNKRPAELRQQAFTRAADFGVDPSAVSKMDKPVLVKVLQDPGNPGSKSSLSNLTAAASESSFSDAVTRGAKINTSTLDSLGRMFDDTDGDATLNGLLNNSTNSMKVRDRLISDGAWQEGDLASFWNGSTGTMTTRGKESVQNMLLSRVLEEHNAAHPSKMPKNVYPSRVTPTATLSKAGNKARNNVEATVPEILRFIRMGEEGRLPVDFSESAQLMKSTLSRALIADAEFSKAGKGTTLGDHFFNQGQLGIGEPLTGTNNLVIATLVNAFRTQGTRMFRKNMRNWLKRIERAKDDDLMGTPGKVRREYWKLDKEWKTKWSKVDENEIPVDFKGRQREAEGDYLKYEGEDIWQSFVEEMGGRDIAVVADNYQFINQPAGDHIQYIADGQNVQSADIGTYVNKKGETLPYRNTLEKYWSPEETREGSGLSPDPIRRAQQENWVDEILNLEEIADETKIGPGVGGGKVVGMDVEHGKQLVFLTGPAAAGKSTMAEAVLKHFRGILLDADIAKRKMPEYAKFPDQATTMTHLESQRVIDAAFDKCIADGTNMVFPKIGSNQGDVAAMAARARDAGFDVHIMSVDLPLTDIVDRAIHRRGHSGRMIPMDVSVGQYGRKSIKVFDDMENNGVMKAHDWWGDRLTDAEGNKIPDIPLKTSSSYAVAMGGEVPFSLRSGKGAFPELQFKTKSGNKRAVDNRIKSEYNVKEGANNAKGNKSEYPVRVEDDRGATRSKSVRTDGESGTRTDGSEPGLVQSRSSEEGLGSGLGEGSKWRDVTEGDLPPNLKEAYRRQLTELHNKHAQSVRDSVVDPLSSGGISHAMSPHLRKRTLGIDYDDVINWTDNEVTRPMMRYDHKISGEVGIRRSISSNPDIFDKYRLPGGGKVKTPEDLRTIVDNEFNVMAEVADRGGDTRASEKIQSLRNKVSRDLFLPMDALRGKNPGNAAVVDPDSFMSFFGRTIQRYNFMNKLGSVGWAQLNDVAPITLYMIARPSTIRFIPRALGMVKDLPRRDLEVLGLWADNMYRTRSINDFDFNTLDYGFGGGRTRKISAAFEQGSAKLSDVSGRISGMNFITNANKRLAGMLTLDKMNVVSKKMIRADKLVQGGMPIEKALRKVRLSRFRAAKVNQMGMDVDSALHYHTQLYNHGVMNDGVTSIKSKMTFDSYMKNEKGFFNPNFEAWTSNPGNKSLLDTIHSRINDEVNRHLVVTPGVYDRPLINFNTWGKMFNQFQTFMTAFLHQRMMPMAQMPAQNQLWYMGTYLMIGSLTDGITNHMSGRRNFSETIDEWEKNPQGMMYKAWVYSGLSGPINRLFGITDALGVPISPGVLSNNRVGGGASQGFYWGDPGTKTVVQSLGPTGSTASTATDVMYDLIGAGEIDETTAYRAATLAPFQNQAILRALYRTTGLPVVPEAIREK
tara:strand:- start:4151 stop:11206 length:7056 start_codon:yes stop_codon:yes gene_type:complete